MQGLFLLVMAGLLWLLWPAEGLQDVGGQQARRILSILAIGELLMIVMFAPAFTAAALTSEREHNTLESLFTTAMKPWQIALGKMVGSLIFLLLLVLSGIPALAMVFLLGGVSGAEILAVIVILLLSAVMLGMIGLMVSALSHRSYRAIIMTYVVLGGLFFVLALPAWPVSGQLIVRYDSSLLHVLSSLSPLEAMISLVWPGGVYAQGASGMPEFWKLFVPLSVAVTFLAMTVCALKLRRPPAPPRPREKLKIVERGKVSARTFFFLFDPRKRKRPITWWKNPVLVKEFRTRPMLQLHWLFRAVGICLIASILLMFLVGAGISAFVADSANMVPMMLTAIAALMVVLIVLVGPAISAGTICSDRETGVWDMLRATPLSSWRFVSGKFQASLIPLALLAIAMLPGMMILLYFNDTLWPSMQRVCYVVGMTMLFVTTTGTFFSSIFSRTSTATAWTYAVVVSMALLSLLVFLGQDLFSQRLIAMIFVFNPVVAAMEAAGHPEMQKYSLLNTHLLIMAALTVVMFTLTVIRVFQLRRAE
jgi:ABC-type transport system involved in multi-copper enzyme maturation permease subunit